MAVTDIIDKHHVVRHCRARLVDLSDKGNPDIFPQAFALRPDEGYLSASYYEYFDGDHDSRMRGALEATKRRFSTIRNDDVMVMINAGEIRRCGVMQQLTLRVVHQPNKNNPDYAGIRGLPEKEDAELGALLCALAVRDIVRVSELCNATEISTQNE